MIPGVIASQKRQDDEAAPPAVVPSIESVAFTSSAGVDNTYKASDVIQVTVTFSEAVEVTGTPQITLNIGGSSEIADYASGDGTTALVFAYTVQSGDTDTNGVSIGANSLALNGGTIKDGDGNDAILTHSAVTDQAAHKVDTTAPTISTVAFTSSAGADNTYKASDVVSVTITWTEAVTVTGTPQLTVNCGGSNKTFNYASGSGSTATVFSYTITGGDTDTNGLSIAANSLALNSGTIRDVAGNNATLTHSSVADQAAHKVDTTAPTISTLSPTDNATDVAVGVNFVVTFSEAIAAGASASFRIYETTGDVLVEEFDESDFGGAVAISGSTLTINWTSDLDNAVDYYVQIDSGSVTDLAGNAFAGIADETTWNITTEAGGATDPDFANVVFLASFEGVDEATSYSEQKNGRALSFGVGTKIDSAHAEYGSTSLFSFNNGTVTIADNNDWDLSDANSDEFTIEFSAYNTDRASTYDYWHSLFGSGNFGWLIRFNAADIQFFWSPDGSSLSSLTASGGVGSANAWHKYCIEKDSSGKIRIYVDGSMATSSTPGDSSMFNASGAHQIIISGSGQTSWMDNCRITKGVARYASDGGYTPATGPFPTS